MRVRIAQILRHIFSISVPFLLGVALTLWYHGSQLFSFHGHSELRRFKSIEEETSLQRDTITFRPTEYISGVIHPTQRQSLPSPQKDFSNFSKLSGIKQKPLPIAKSARFSTYREQDVVSQNYSAFPFVKWTSDEVLRHLAAYTAPSPTDLAEKLTDKYGFDEKPPVPLLRGYKSPCWFSKTEKPKLKCLPGFYIAGFPKCGTMDLWFRMKRHPQLRALTTRETNWWTRSRYGTNGSVPLGNFSRNLGDSLARWGRNAHKLVLGEGSPSNMWMTHIELRDIWANDSNDQAVLDAIDNPVAAPMVLTPHLIKMYTPQAKFIVIMRNPADRIFSHFCYYGNKTNNPQDYDFMRTTGRFHRLVVQMVAMYQECFARRSIRDCAYDPTLSKECNRYKIRIDRTLYAVYISDWLKVFPREQFHFVRTEDYGSHTPEVLGKIFTFLELDKISIKSLEYIANGPRKHTHEKHSVYMPPMLSITRKLLDDFFRPFNEALVKIVHDEMFLWKKETTWSASA